MGRYVPRKTERNPREHIFSIVQNLTVHHILPHDKENTAIQTMHTAKQIVYSKRTDGKLLLLKICKSRKWLITYQYLPLLKDGILRRVTVLLYLSKPTYRAKEKIMKKHYITKGDCFITYRTLLKGRLALKYFRRTSRSLILWWDNRIRSDEGIAPERYPWEFLVGMCRPVLRILALF